LCQQKNSDGASLPEEVTCPDCLITKNRPEMGLERARRILHHILWQYHPLPFHNTSPLSFALSVALPLALYLTWWYAPAFSVKSWAVLLFGGISMVLAALRGYAGCEMLALSN
jgi:hypothetical protein